MISYGKAAQSSRKSSLATCRPGLRKTKSSVRTRSRASVSRFLTAVNISSSRSRSACCASASSSLFLFDVDASSTSNDARNQKMALVALRRLLQRLLLSRAGLDLVGARGVRGLDLSRALMTPGFDRGRVKLVELIDIFDDRRELIRKKLFLFGRKFKIGQRGDLFDFRLC